MTAVGESRLAGLVALRDELARSIEAADPPLVAGLARQLRDTLAEIDAMPAVEGGDKLDELAARRANEGGLPAADVVGAPVLGTKSGRRRRGVSS